MVTIAALDVLPFVINLILIVSSIGLYLAHYLRTKWMHWETRGVPCMQLGPCLGISKDLILQRVPVAFIFQRIYKELEGHKFGGFYRLAKPSIMIRDPELIKAVFVKNFSNFQDRDRFPAGVDDRIDPLASHLVNLTGQRWRNVRYKLTPTFSSGKLRHMASLIRDCVCELDEYLIQTTSVDAITGNIQNVKELMGKYVIDVIWTCAFGVHCNSIRDEDSEFRRIGWLISKPAYRNHIWELLRICIPQLISLFKVKQRDPEVYEFFKSVLEQAIKHRESSILKRNTFLQLMIDIQVEEKAQLPINGQNQNGTHVNGSNEKSTKSPSNILFTDNVIASNAFMFFFAGFEATTFTLSFCLYELALNPEICEKMKDEVESLKRAHNGDLDYNSIKQLVYIDAVISETLRKYPPGSIISRRCTESFHIPDSSVVIEKGTSVHFSIYGLHHDPKYFPEPERFLPERFSEENKGSIVPGTYLPFGDGPRHCIGMRFARFQMKSVLSHLVSKYTFHPCEKTVIPLKFNRRSSEPLLTPLGDIWIQFRKRSTS